MDAMARGIATAALTLQSTLLQSLAYRGAMTPGEALGVVDEALEAAKGAVRGKDEQEVANIARKCLESVRESLKEMMN
jgi:hypothetical protein